MKSRNIHLKKHLGSLGRALMILVLLWTVPPQKTYAQTPIYNTAFLTDAELEDSNSMSVDEIRAFLADHNSYLRQAIHDVDNVSFDPPDTLGRAAVQYNISPKVLLATLQKESSGVTAPQPPNNLGSIMGCRSGVTLPEPEATARGQLWCAAERFRAYQDQLNSSGSTVSGWKVGVEKKTSDGVLVTPATKAVAGQFTYTPHAGKRWGGTTAGGVSLFYELWINYGFSSSGGGSIPTPGSTPTSGWKVTLDPGHGWNHDSGASANGMLEKDITLDIANLVKPLLEAQGIQVSMTRTGDEPNYGLDEAVKRANQFQPDIVVAIHVNAGGGSGTESCYQMVGSCSDPNSDECKNRPANDNSKKLGELLTNSEVNKFGFTKRGDFPEHTAGRCDRYATTKWTHLYIHNMTSPAAVIETAFIDGPANVDVKLLRENRADFAQAIAEAIFSYLGISTTPPKQSASSATMLVVDVSGSMGDPWQGGIKIDSAKAAANQIVNMLEQESQVAGVSHRVGIATFTTDAMLNLGLTGDYNRARTEISGLFSQNSTNVGAGLSVANDELKNANAGEAKFIILLSDGMSNEGLSNDQILAGPVQNAANAGTCIYTVGFGDQGDIDENLLRQIAAGSGCGQYYYATDVNELEQIYIRIRHQSIGKVLGEFTGTIAQGQTVQAGSVVVPPGQDQLAVTLNWPGSKLSLVVTDPNGNVVSPNDPNVNIKEYANLIYMMVMWPIPGTWQLAVTGVDIPEGSTIYDAIASSRTGTLPTPTPTPTIIPQKVITPVPSKPTSGPDSGFSILVVILIAALGGMGVYVYTIRLRQKRPGQVSVRPGNPVSASLLISNGPRMGQVIPLGVQPLAIGRGPVNDLPLSEDASVSRQHAVIRYAEGRWFLQDQGSGSGTFVNNMPVNAVVLNPGDQIRIGSTIIVFRT